MIGVLRVIQIVHVLTKPAGTVQVPEPVVTPVIAAVITHPADACMNLIQFVLTLTTDVDTVEHADGFIGNDTEPPLANVAVTVTGVSVPTMRQAAPVPSDVAVPVDVPSSTVMLPPTK